MPQSISAAFLFVNLFLSESEDGIRMRKSHRRKRMNLARNL